MITVVKLAGASCRGQTRGMPWTSKSPVGQDVFDWHQNPRRPVLGQSTTDLRGRSDQGDVVFTFAERPISVAGTNGPGQALEFLIDGEPGLECASPFSCGGDRPRQLYIIRGARRPRASEWLKNVSLPQLADWVLRTPLCGGSGPAMMK
jgi:hypothetical protein